MNEKMNEGEIEQDVNPEFLEIWETLSRVSRKSRKKITYEFDSLGIKPVEFKVLYLLSRDGAKSMVSLATESEVSGPWITGVVDELERKGLVNKIRSDTDRRMIRVKITDKGRAVLSKGTQAYRKLIKLAMKDLTSDESAEFLGILRKMDRTMED
jgi:MarR family 2-MHQ and catechol resistance regulon transcriptional repressor